MLLMPIWEYLSKQLALPLPCFDECNVVSTEAEQNKTVQRSSTWWEHLYLYKHWITVAGLQHPEMPYAFLQSSFLQTGFVLENAKNNGGFCQGWTPRPALYNGAWSKTNSRLPSPSFNRKHASTQHLSATNKQTGSPSAASSLGNQTTNK